MDDVLEYWMNLYTMIYCNNVYVAARDVALVNLKINNVISNFARNGRYETSTKEEVYSVLF